MLRFTLLCLFMICCFAGNAGGDRRIDSLKAKLDKTTTAKDRIHLLGMLARMYMNISIEEADRYGVQLVQEAERTRDRHLMAQALMINGERLSYFSFNKDFVQRSIEYYNKALDLARQNKSKLNKEMAECLISLSRVYATASEPDKAMSYANQAFSIISGIKDDSLKVAAYYSLGMVYQLRKEKILALRNYLNALNLAEEAKSPVLMRSCYAVLSSFYADLKEYDKAIDYADLMARQLPLTNLENKEELSVVDLYTMGNLYAQKKDFDNSLFYYEWSIRKADSLNYQPLKMPGFNGILVQHIRAKQPAKALEYFNNAFELKEFAARLGFNYQLDNAYGTIYDQLGMYDSARFYFDRAAPYFERTGTPLQKMSHYFLYADFLKHSGATAAALDYYTRAWNIADQTGDLEWQKRAAGELDSLYAGMGDFRKSREFNAIYHRIKDSLQKLSEEKDLLQMELEDEQQRAERLKREEQEKKRAKHNIQYLGITIGIAVLFIALVMMGTFSVSAGTIKVVGFFAFLMLFEFIFLVFKKNIYGITHGEPWKDLAFMIGIAALLVPLHHTLEHRVVHFLTSRKLIVPSRKGIFKTLLTKTKAADPHQS